jgi:hypothetical protein
VLWAGTRLDDIVGLERIRSMSLNRVPGGLSREIPLSNSNEC